MGSILNLVKSTRLDNAYNSFIPSSDCSDASFFITLYNSSLLATSKASDTPIFVNSFNIAFCFCVLMLKSKKVLISVNIFNPFSFSGIYSRADISFIKSISSLVSLSFGKSLIYFLQKSKISLSRLMFLGNAENLLSISSYTLII